MIFISLVPIYTQSLSFQTIQHAITTTDTQMTVDGGLLVFVVGQLKVNKLCVWGKGVVTACMLFSCTFGSSMAVFRSKLDRFVSSQGLLDHSF